jgi:hypothetical protein
LSVQNGFKYTEEEVPNNVLQESTAYKKKNIFVMADPQSEGIAFNWLDQFGTTDNLPANSLYITGSQKSTGSEITLLWPDDDIEVVTGVKGVQNADITDRTGKVMDGVYTLTGQKVGTAADFENLPKGLYIVNGKKVMKR